MTEPPKVVVAFAPRGMRRPESARYIGVSPSKFDQMVLDERMPPPREVDKCRIWDRLELDEAFEALPHKEEGNSWD